MSEPITIPPFVVTHEGLQYAPWQPIRVFALPADAEGPPRELPLSHYEAARVERESAIHKAYADLTALYPPGLAALLALQSLGEEVTPDQEAALMLGRIDTPPP